MVQMDGIMDRLRRLVMVDPEAEAVFQQVQDQELQVKDIPVAQVAVQQTVAAAEVQAVKAQMIMDQLVDLVVPDYNLVWMVIIMEQAVAAEDGKRQPVTAVSVAAAEVLPHHGTEQRIQPVPEEPEEDSAVVMEQQLKPEQHQEVTVELIQDPVVAVVLNHIRTDQEETQIVPEEMADQEL
jgi:hypothetical protein